MSRLLRRFAPLAVAAFLCLNPLAARAQDAGLPAQEEEKSDTEMVVGYMITGLLSTGAIFILCKSSRR